MFPESCVYPPAHSEGTAAPLGGDAKGWPCRIHPRRRPGCARRTSVTLGCPTTAAEVGRVGKQGGGCSVFIASCLE